MSWLSRTAMHSSVQWTIPRLVCSDRLVCRNLLREPEKYLLVYSLFSRTRLFWGNRKVLLIQVASVLSPWWLKLCGGGRSQFSFFRVYTNFPLSPLATGLAYNQRDSCMYHGPSFSSVFAYAFLLCRLLLLSPFHILNSYDFFIAQ